MLGLRHQVAKKDASQEEDLEAPEVKDFLEKSATPLGARTTSGAAINPVYLTNAIFRKVLTILMASDEEDATETGGIVTLLRDIILGLILGVVFISSFIFLDHVGIVHSQSARNFRNAAFQLLNDPDTIAHIEESSDLKFMAQAHYDSMRKEIDALPQKKADLDKLFRTRQAEMEKNSKEIESMRHEHDQLMNDPLLGVHKFCPQCTWAGKVTCAMRATFLEDTYNTEPFAAKIAAMEVATCRRQG